MIIFTLLTLVLSKHQAMFEVLMHPPKNLDVEAPTDVPVAETPTEKPDAYQAPIGENLVWNAGFEDHGNSIKDIVDSWKA